MAEKKRKAACVIGWPIEHSRSPLIHNYWIDQLGLEAEYRREAVPPDGFAEFVARLGEHGYVGANVTVPHKESALALADADEWAEAVGAANTLWLDKGKLRATNTDVEGFIGNLDAGAPGWDAPDTPMTWRRSRWPASNWLPMGHSSTWYRRSVPTGAASRAS
jgi:shikimate dehydrogenase